jgi:hypothetical protein
MRFAKKPNPFTSQCSRYRQILARGILASRMRAKFLAALVVVFVSWNVAEADYVLVLKNGRQITVQSYRTEGSMIKFNGMGGEIAISKEQIQTIRPVSEIDRGGSSGLALDKPEAPSAKAPLASETKSSPTTAPPTPVKRDEQLAKQRAEEEKAYQQKLKDLTEQLQEARDRYSLTTRGTKGPEPSFFTTDEAFKGQQEDLITRLRDAQYRAQGLPTGSAANSPPLSLDPPPPYTEKQKELSDMRSRMFQLENQRQQLIDEMKAKNFDAGSSYLE